MGHRSANAVSNVRGILVLVLRTSSVATCSACVCVSSRCGESSGRGKENVRGEKIPHLTHFLLPPLDFLNLSVLPSATRGSRHDDDDGDDSEMMMRIHAHLLRSSCLLSRPAAVVLLSLPRFRCACLCVCLFAHSTFYTSCFLSLPSLVPRRGNKRAQSTDAHTNT